MLNTLLPLIQRLLHPSLTRKLIKPQRNVLDDNATRLDAYIRSDTQAARCKKVRLSDDRSHFILVVSTSRTVIIAPPIVTHTLWLNLMPLSCLDFFCLPILLIIRVTFSQLLTFADAGRERHWTPAIRRNVRSESR